MKLTLTGLAALLFVPCALAQDKHAFSVDDMLAMDRISDPQVSPDGKWVAYNLRTTDLAANRGRTDVWIAALDGSSSRQIGRAHV